MSNTKHTPGPWALTETLSNNQTVIRGADGSIVCDYSLNVYKVAARLNLYSGNKNTTTDKSTYQKAYSEIDEMEIANAKLIAAAPDLLENLMRIIDRIEENGYHTSFTSAYERAKSAIERATK